MTKKVTAQVVDSGLVNLDALNACLGLQRKYLRRSELVTLPEILLKKGLVTLEQISDWDLDVDDVGKTPDTSSERKRPFSEENPVSAPDGKQIDTAPFVREWKRVIYDGMEQNAPIITEIDSGDTVPNLRIRPGRIIKSGDSGTLRPDYELLRQIGEGGMGAIYSARQMSLDRKVALKVIKPGKRKQNTRRKFIREAVVTGNLEHPNIVPVYDLGSSRRGHLFYSMKHVEGVPWSRVYSEKSEEENIEILLKVADAVAFAHSKGVLHRDIKPDNVMLGTYGEVLLMDWGLSASFERHGKAERLTEKNARTGTPAYMSPEVAQGKTDKIGPHSDVYLLGATLFEVVTGKRPHSGKTVLDCIENAAKNIIPNNRLSGELKAIIQKAMADEYRDRYASVEELQQALRVYLAQKESIALSRIAFDDLRGAKARKDYDGFAKSLFGFRRALKLWPENVKADIGMRDAALSFAEHAAEKQDYDLAAILLNGTVDQRALPRESVADGSMVNPLELSQRIASGIHSRETQKKRIHFLRITIITLLVLILGAGIVIHFLILEEKKRRFETERFQQREAYYRILTLADRKIDAGEIDSAKKLLEAAPVRFRSFEWKKLNSRCVSPEILFSTPVASIDALAFSSNGNLLAFGGDGRVFIRDARMKEKSISLIGEIGDMTFLDFSNNAKYLFSQHPDGTIKIWNRETAELAGIRKTRGICDKNIVFSEDGTGKLVLLPEGGFDLIDVETGKKRYSISGAPVSCAAFSSDGRYFATGFNNGWVRVRRRETGMEQVAFRVRNRKIRALAFSNDNRLLAHGDDKGTIQIWNLEKTVDRVFLSGNRGNLLSAAFSSNGKRVLTGSTDGTVIIHDGISGKIQVAIRNPDTKINSVSFSPDDSMFVTGSSDGRVRIRDALSGKKIRSFGEPGDNILFVAFSPDGRRLIFCGEKGVAAILSPSSGKVTKTLERRMKALQAAAWSPDGKFIATAGNEGIVNIYEASSGKKRYAFKDHSDTVTDLTFSPDGKKIISASLDGTVLIRDLGKKNPVLSLVGHEIGVNSVCINADGNRIVTGGEDGTYRVWDAATGRELISAQTGISAIRAVQFSPDGKTLLTCGDSPLAIIWK